MTKDIVSQKSDSDNICNFFFCQVRGTIVFLVKVEIAMSRSFLKIKKQTCVLSRFFICQSFPRDIYPHNIQLDTENL